MNILLVVGLIMLLGMIGGRILNKFNLPQVMGYMIIGLLLGESFHGMLTEQVVDSMLPLISLALGIIGFMIGSELHRDRFKRYSRSIYTILLVEAFLTFIVVTGVTFLITQKIYIGIILGALASATAPAATYSVLGEYKARGPVTTTTLSLVALDDGLALLIYGFASVFARSMIVSGELSLFNMFGMPLFQITVSVFIGAIAGYVLHLLGKRMRSRERMLPCTLGTIILVVGLSIYFKVDPILASMVLGAVAANLQSSENKEMFDIIKRFSPPIFILFFVLIGARLDAGIVIKGNVLLLAIAYILSRSFGKVAGAYIGGKLSRAKSTVTRYLGFCLFDQAGVAVGLALATFHSFSGLGEEARGAGILILNIIMATTFLLQLLSPPMIKYGISKADEINRDITEEDVVNMYRISNVMEEDFFALRENNNLHEIIDIMKKSSAYTFPVVSMGGEFIGVVSLGDIREAFYEDQMDQLILANDIVREMDEVVYADQELSEAMDIFTKKNIDYLPVLFGKDGRKLVGQLEYNKLKDHITKEVLLRQREIDS